ncbi:MAG: hypothetical protein ABJH04_18680 [Cyclobacteriaceae bacterium]
MSKVNSTISQIVEYALKEDQGGYLLMSNVGSCKELIISYFKAQQKKHGKNSISSFIIAQHCGHKVTDKKWAEIWNDLFLELKVTDPKYVVGKHIDGSQDHCHGLLAQFRLNQYLSDEDFISKVPNKANDAIYKKNKRKLSAKLFELARKLEAKHQLPALSLSIHYTREYYIPAKFRFKDLMRSIIDESIDSAKTLNEYEKRLQEISSIGIPKFKATLIENKKYNYLNRIFDATVMTFEPKQWCNYENVFKIGDFKCRGSLLGPEYTKERILERIINNSTKQEVDKSNEMYNDSQKIELDRYNKELRIPFACDHENNNETQQESDILEAIKDSWESHALEFNNERINFNHWSWEGHGLYETKLNLEFSVYERLIDKSDHNENCLVLKCEALNKNINEELAALRDVNQIENDEKYELRMELIKSTEENNRSRCRNIELIEEENLKRIRLYKEYLKKLQAAILDEKLNNQLMLQRMLIKTEKEREMELRKLRKRATLNKKLIEMQKLRKSSIQIIQIAAIKDIERLIIKKDIINSELEKILHKRELLENKNKTQSSELVGKKMEQNLLRIFNNKNSIDCESLKEVRNILIRVDSLFSDSSESQSIKLTNKTAKENVLEKVNGLNNNWDVKKKPYRWLKEDDALKMYNNLLNDFTSSLIETNHVSSNDDLGKLTLNISALIYLKEKKEEIVDVVKSKMKQYNSEMTHIWKLDLSRKKQIEREDYPNNDHSIDNDHSQQLGLQMIPPWLKQNGLNP